MSAAVTERQRSRAGEEDGQVGAERARGHPFLAMAGGLIQLDLGALVPESGERVRSHTIHYTEKRALKWWPVALQAADPGRWDWALITRMSRGSTAGYGPWPRERSVPGRWRPRPSRLLPRAGVWRSRRCRRWRPYGLAIRSGRRRRQWTWDVVLFRPCSQPRPAVVLFLSRSRSRPSSGWDGECRR